VSEPLADYLRFEHAITDEVNISAGEQVRWLPRRLGGDLCVPLNDYWVLDNRLVRFGYFAGNGTFLEGELLRGVGEGRRGWPRGPAWSAARPARPR
jgi:hypothetical protein